MNDKNIEEIIQDFHNLTDNVNGSFGGKIVSSFLVSSLGDKGDNDVKGIDTESKFLEDKTEGLCNSVQMKKKYASLSVLITSKLLGKNFPLFLIEKQACIIYALGKEKIDFICRSFDITQEFK